MFLERVLTALGRHNVDHALIGGYAVALHGAVRGTVDIDLVIALDASQYELAETALNSLGLQSRLPVSAREVFSFRGEYISNRNLTAWSFFHPDNPLQVVDIIITEDLKNLTIIEKRVGNLRIPIASIGDLIRMKQQSARPQDIEDIKALERLQ